MIRYRAGILFSISISFLSLSEGITPPSHITISYAEKSLDISWDSVPGAIGYNIYTANVPHMPQSKKRKINQKLITSGTHFTYLWHFEKGEKVRKIKGYKHYLSVTAVSDTTKKRHESTMSPEQDNDYFEGYKKMVTKRAIQKVLLDTQKTSLLPIANPRNTRDAFIRFMEGPGKTLHELVKKQVDPKETGGCVPVSTILVKLLHHFGLSALRIDGTFIKEYHTFVITNIDMVEYILDFTADQFIPDVTPVLIPRDYCHLDENGKLALTGTPAYSIAKVYHADQIELSDEASATLYKKIYDTVIARHP